MADLGIEFGGGQFPFPAVNSRGGSRRSFPARFRGGVVDGFREFEGGGVVDGVFRPDFEGGIVDDGFREFENSRGGS